MTRQPGANGYEFAVDSEGTTVRDIAAAIPNAVVGGPFGSDLVSNDYVSDGVPVIRGQNMGGRWVSGNFVYVSRAKAQALEANLARPGDIVFTQRGTLGQVSLVPDSPYSTYLVSQSQMKVTLDNTKCDSLFYYYYFAGPAAQNYIRSNVIQTGVPHINLGILRGIPVPLLRIGEQKAIAEVLSDADALIESLEQLIAKKRQIKQGAMHELLTGKRRLPGFRQRTSYKQTDIGDIPVDWEAKRLGDIGDSLIGLTYKPTDVRSDGLLVLRSSNIYEGNLRFDDNVFVGMSVPERIMVRAGDILICVRNGSRDLIGKCALIGERDVGMTFGAFMAVFRSVFHRFVYHAIHSQVIKRQIHEHLGATINQITNKSLNSFQIPFPPNEAEREAIALSLSDMDAETSALESKLAKARSLKQGMTQELLTGRIRLV